MRRMILYSLVAMGAVLLIVTGAIAGVLLADDSGDTSTTTTTQDSGTGKGSLGLTVSFSSQTGLRVSAVEADGPAAKAGIQVGDVVRSIDGQVVRTPEQLKAAEEAKKPGDRVTLTFERADQELRAQVEVGEARTSASANPTPPTTRTPASGQPNQPALSRGGRLGVTVQQITPQFQQRLNLSRGSGIVVTEVTANSAGATAGLQRGDVILTVGSTQISTVPELQRAVLAAPAQQAVEIGIQRGADQMTLSAVLPAQATLDGLGDLLPDALRERLQELIDSGVLRPEQLQQYLRLFQARGQGVQVGTVDSVNPGTAGGFIITMSPYIGGNDASIEVNDQTSIMRGTKRIQAGEIEKGELVLVLSTDNGRTAFQVFVLGKL